MYLCILINDKPVKSKHNNPCSLGNFFYYIDRGLLYLKLYKKEKITYKKIYDFE